MEERYRYSGLGSKFGHLDSGSALHVPVKKFPEATESGCFIDTRGIYRSARNDDLRDDSLLKWPMLRPSPVFSWSVCRRRIRQRQAVCPTVRWSVGTSHRRGSDGSCSAVDFRWLFSATLRVLRASALNVHIPSIEGGNAEAQRAIYRD